VIWDGVKLDTPAPLATGVVTRTPEPPPAGQPRSQPDPRVAGRLECPPGQLQASELAEQGSGRVYRRLRDPGGKSFVWVKYQLDRPENANFATCARFLQRCGVRTPDVLLHLPEVREMLLQDLGDQCLLDIAGTAGGTDVLRQCIAMAARLHALGPGEIAARPIPLEEPFAAELYAWERDYFREMALRRLFAQSELWTDAVQRQCLAGQELLLAQAQVPLHRDLQSANVMVRNSQPYFIDFQGMRLGVGTYDAASLLYDPYACWDESVREDMWGHYIDQVARLGAAPPERTLLTAAAVQRLLQAVGAYAKLWLVDGRPWYSPYVRPGLYMLAAATCGVRTFTAVHGMALRLRDLPFAAEHDHERPEKDDSETDV
jgi:hypothetical protein